MVTTAFISSDLDSAYLTYYLLNKTNEELNFVFIRYEDFFSNKQLEFYQNKVIEYLDWYRENIRGFNFRVEKAKDEDSNFINSVFTNITSTNSYWKNIPKRIFNMLLISKNLNTEKVYIPPTCDISRFKLSKDALDNVLKKENIKYNCISNNIEYNNKCELYSRLPTAIKSILKFCQSEWETGDKCGSCFRCYTTDILNYEDQEKINKLFKNAEQKAIFEFGKDNQLEIDRFTLKYVHDLIKQAG